MVVSCFKNCSRRNRAKLAKEQVQRLLTKIFNKYYFIEFKTLFKDDIILVGGTNVVSIKTGELDAFGEEEIIDVRAEHIPITGDKGTGRDLLNIY